MKATLILKVAGAYTAFLSDEIRILAGAYSRALSGTPQAQNQEKEPTIWHKATLTKPSGLWYAGEKFLPEAKADVEAKLPR